MKRFFLLAALSVFSLGTFAQPVLTNATNSPIIGDIFYTYWCDSNSFSAVPAGGAGATWDYSLLVTSSIDTSTVVSCASTSYCDSFPGSTMECYQPGVYNYYTTNANEWAITGSYYPGFGAQYCSEPYKILSYPFTYGTTVVDTSLTYGYFGYSDYTSEIDTVNADAYGTLILPTGTYTNVLRLHVTQYIVDTMITILDTIIVSPGDTSFGGPDTTVTYDLQDNLYLWYQPGFHTALLTIYFDYTSINYSGMTESGIASINSAGFNLVVSPNPANDVVQIKFDLPQNNNASITVSDISGRVVGTINSTEIKAGANDISYPVSGLPDGVYFIHLKSDDHNTTEKIMKISNP